MGNNILSLRELQEEINKGLGRFAGRKYEGTEFHAWYSEEINNVFRKYEITQIRPSTWGIVTDESEQGVSLFCERIAEINIDFKRDKRCTYKNRGIILSIAVCFREELLPLTIAAARRLLLEQMRDKMIENCAAIAEKARREANEAEAERARLATLTF